MSVCPIHNIECDDGGWICPVCAKDRCRECEYVNCVVDGRKKDYECCFNCQFCQGMAGKDHEANCALCGAIGCDNCIRPSALDNRPICPDCGHICSVCGQMYSNASVDKCELCPSYVCTICGIRECEICGKKVCHQHSFKCAGCDKWICKECLGGIDAISGDRLCIACVYTCPTCGSTVAASAAKICDSCGAPICLKCSRECSRCGRRFCKNHINRCSICNEYICESHSDICPACGGYCCNSHFFRCEVCEIGYCTKCRPHKTENICNLCDNLVKLEDGDAKKFLERLQEKEDKISGLSNWEYSVGREIYIFYGKSLFSNYLVVADRKSGNILKTQRVGVMDKLRKMFS